MTQRKINEIAEDFAKYTTANASPLDKGGCLQYYFAGSVATILTCNAATIEDVNSEKEKISVSCDDRAFLQNNFPRQTGDVDIITFDDEAHIMNFSPDRSSMGSRRIKEAIPDAGEFCSAFSGRLQSNMFWDSLSAERKITHKISKITTEQGNSFYVPRPDYQLANKMSELVILNFEDNDMNKKKVKDISIMFASFSKMYSNEELLDAFSICLKDKEKSGTLPEGQNAKASFKKLAPKMKDYLQNNIPNSEDAINRVQNMLNYIEKPLDSKLMTIASCRDTGR